MINRQSLLFFLASGTHNSGESVNVAAGKATGQVRLQTGSQSLNISFSDVITTKPLQATGQSFAASISDAAGIVRQQASGQSLNVSLSDVITTKPFQATGQSFVASISDAAGIIRQQASGQSVNSSFSNVVTNQSLQAMGQSFVASISDAVGIVRQQASGQSLNVSLSEAVTNKPLQATGQSINIVTNDALAQMRLTTTGESYNASLNNTIGELVIKATGQSISVVASNAPAQMRLMTTGDSVDVSLGDAAGILGNSYLVYTQANGEIARLRSCLPAGSTTTTLKNHPANWDGLTWVVAVSKCGVIQSDPAIKKQVAFDAADQLIGQRPDAPAAITLTAIAGGKMTVQWTFIKRPSKPLPTAFNIYLNVGQVGFDFAAPPAAVVTHTGGSRYSQTIGPYTTGTVVQAIVRPVAALGAESNNTLTASATADATPPAVPSGVAWEVTA